MNNKILGILTGIVIIVIIVIAVSNQNKETVTIEYATSTVTTSADIQNTIPSQTTPSTMSPSEVATHNSRTDCYTIVRGKVYNVTSWISQHPGGADAILSLCGKDGTTAFEGQHDGQNKPESQLATFFVADLAQ